MLSDQDTFCDCAQAPSLISAPPVATVCWILENILQKIIQQQQVCWLQAKQRQAAVEAAVGSAPDATSHSAGAWGHLLVWGQRHNMPRDGAKGTRYVPSEFTRQCCFIAEHKTHLFSDTSQI